MPRAIYFSKLKGQWRNRDAFSKCYKDERKCHFALTGIKESNWQQMVSERYSWKALTKSALLTFEAQRKALVENRYGRDKRKL